MSEKHVCQKRLSIDSWHFRPCGKTAKFYEDDKWYCGLHAPSKQAERAAKRGPTVYEREMAYREHQKKELELARAVVEAARAAYEDSIEVGDGKHEITEEMVLQLSDKLLAYDNHMKGEKG